MREKSPRMEKNHYLLWYRLAAHYRNLSLLLPQAPRSIPSRKSSSNFNLLKLLLFFLPRKKSFIQIFIFIFILFYFKWESFARFLFIHFYFMFIFWFEFYLQKKKSFSNVKNTHTHKKWEKLIFIFMNNVFFFIVAE